MSLEGSHDKQQERLSLKGLAGYPSLGIILFPLKDRDDDNDNDDDDSEKEERHDEDRIMLVLGWGFYSGSGDSTLCTRWTLALQYPLQLR